MSAKEPALSERMKHVLMLVSPHMAVADVGCDHGYMAIELIRSGKAGHVIAMDINEGPLARARANVSAYGLCDEIETRRSDGMEALCRGEVQGVICAGMGGKTICGIMERSRLLVRELDELVLQPQSELHIVRGYLRENGFLIAKEDMVSEDGKFYPMMRVIPARGAEKKAPDSMETGNAEAGAQRQRVEDRYGPCLLAEGHPVLRQYLQRERAVCEEVLRNLSQTDTERGLSRREELTRRLSDIAIAEKITVKLSV
ncbi:MAG: SAM-dependent methyltransferase [Lachnospiraceae bacterium]|nr:SAM-dependent methyltransferase [Lachnospiraceae bacterium]